MRKLLSLVRALFFSGLALLLAGVLAPSSAPAAFAAHAATGLVFIAPGAIAPEFPNSTIATDDGSRGAMIPEAVQVKTKPFRLPYSTAPGYGTWLLGQGYGNTPGAYRQRQTTYVLGQGIHFGVDLSAPCGTQIVAVADGIVSEVDNLRYGSAPHNLIIRHDNGYASFYGHLLERPRLQAGQPVRVGQPVALSGDPDETCHSRPHLHLEIRDNSYAHAFNPIEFIQADWDNLALVGQFGRGFEKDLDNPRKWQFLDDQPSIGFGLPLVNDFARAWPVSFGFER